MFCRKLFCIFQNQGYVLLGISVCSAAAKSNRKKPISQKCPTKRLICEPMALRLSVTLLKSFSGAFSRAVKNVQLQKRERCRRACRRRFSLRQEARATNLPAIYQVVIEIFCCGLQIFSPEMSPEKTLMSTISVHCRNKFGGKSFPGLV